MPVQTLDFTDHRRQLHANRYIYAVVSRRSRGLSIGVNLNPDKVCNFSCPYCQVDRTIPGGDRDVDVALLGSELESLLNLVESDSLWQVPPFDTASVELRRVRDLTIAGDGEPTACPQFPQTIDTLGKICSAHDLRFGTQNPLSLNLMTNATLFHRRKVWEALVRFGELGGEVWAKLDAGTQSYFEQVDGTRLSLDRVVRNIARAAAHRPVVLQCLFMSWKGEGPSGDEIRAWTGRLQEILDAGGQIRLVQVYTLARRPADPRAGILPVGDLDVIAGQARELGLEVEVIAGVKWES
jgi:wyosine [tRNA(Phe)-imidazoG37] synthetase (radical SAM superfamily)